MLAGFEGPKGPSYFWALWSFQMFVSPLFQSKLYLLSTVLLSGFQSSPGALKPTE